MAWDGMSRNHANALCYAAVHCKEVDKEYFHCLSGFVKSHVELHFMAQEIMKMGSSPAEREGEGRGEALQKQELSLQTTLARCEKFAGKIKTNDYQERLAKGPLSLTEEVKASDELISKSRKLLDEHLLHFLGKADAVVQQVMKQLQPIAGGLRNGQSWKDKVEEICFFCTMKLKFRF